MQKKIFKNTFIVSFAAVLLTTALLLIGIYSMLEKNTLEDMRQETLFIAGGVNYYQDEDYLELPFFKNSIYRITIIGQSGQVIFDNKAQGLKSHKDRPEYIAAIETGAGSEKRYSNTIGKTSYYYAYRLNNGNVIRLGCTKNNILVGFLQMIPLMLGVLILVVIASFILVKRTAIQIMKPVNEMVDNLDGSRKMKSFNYEEFTPFIQKINGQREEIKTQIENLKKDRDTISTITENMKEGLILLDKNENILSLNKYAKEILNIRGEEFLGKNIITATRNELINKAAKMSIQGKHDESILEQEGKFYQVHGCDVENAEEKIGTILFLVDITSEQEALKMRKEFTANVSHELKTPLTSISGYAEMMQNGMIQSDDMQKFAGKIFKDCGQMITLVNDIITLSKLDESREDIMMESVDVLWMADKSAANLKVAAEKAGVEIFVEGESTNLTTSKTMLNQLFNNLLENAVKYNKRGGKVTVKIESLEETVKIVVEDTGMGIQENDRDRIFERFYRADKSRSKNIGGTGLGLSIVKHIVLVLGGKIELNSEVGKGTIITVELKFLS